MKKKISAIFCIALILLSGTSNLFAESHHECRMEMQKQGTQCPMTMQKMDCCPVDQEDNSCKCPEMNSNNDLPNETEPVVFFDNLAQNFGKFITLQYQILNNDFDTEKGYTSFNNQNTPISNIKIYKTIQSFLI